MSVIFSLFCWLQTLPVGCRSNQWTTSNWSAINRNSCPHTIRNAQDIFLVEKFYICILQSVTICTCLCFGANSNAEWNCCVYRLSVWVEATEQMQLCQFLGRSCWFASDSYLVQRLDVPVIHAWLLSHQVVIWLRHSAVCKPCPLLVVCLFVQALVEMNSQMELCIDSVRVRMCCRCCDSPAVFTRKGRHGMW